MMCSSTGVTEQYATELTIMVNAIDEIGTKGEKKLAQFVRGSNEAWIKSLPYLSSSMTYGKSPSNLPLEWWRQFARQCSVAGYLDRKVDCGTFQGRQAGVYFPITKLLRKEGMPLLTKRSFIATHFQSCYISHTKKFSRII